MHNRLMHIISKLARQSSAAQSVALQTDSMSSPRLPPTIHPGILNLPGSTPQSKALVEKLLEEDRDTHHCLYYVGFHNHLSHQWVAYRDHVSSSSGFSRAHYHSRNSLLAAYDLGAPAPLLQSIYDANIKGLVPLHAVDLKTGAVEEQKVRITTQNWTEFLGQAKYVVAV